MMLQKLRRKAFWIFDKLKGSPVKSHLEEISSLLEGSDSFSAQNIIKQHKERLFRHAKDSTGFYSDYKSARMLEEFPVVNKNIIRKHFEEFNSSLIREGEKIPAVTSGSTGTPFKVYQSQDKKNRNAADTIYFARKAGYDIGQRLIYLKIWAEEKMASPFHYWMQNIMPVDVLKLTHDKISSLIADLEQKKCRYSILGYVSALERICKYLDRIEKDRVDTDIASIITMSESLTPYVKKKMETYFGAKVYARYSNLENGILAQQVPGSGGKYLLNRASYIVEILKMDSDEPASVGEPGRIVVTDLFNLAMPMIRYDTGDIGIKSEATDGYGNTYLDKVEGRKLDILYDTSGNVVSSYIMYKNMWQYTEIKQYQLIQEDEKKYTFKINIDGKFEKEKQLINEYKSFLGHDAEFNVEYVDEIPLLSSGKRKKTVNNWKKN